MKPLNLLLISLILVSIVSCTTTRRTTATAKTMDIYGAGVIQKAVVADLDVKETKTTGSAIGSSTTQIEITKHEAVVQAIKK